MPTIRLIDKTSKGASRLRDKVALLRSIYCEVFPRFKRSEAN